MTPTNGESQHSSGGNSIDKDDDNLLAQTSRLSHVMLQVPSVDETVAYWKETAKGQVTASSQVDKKKDDNDDKDELRSAFVVLGNGKTLEDCFALELVKNKHKTFQLGNAVSYLGVSKLVQYSSQEDLIGIILSGADKSKNQGDATSTSTTQEPNGISVESCAAAPGDFLSRLCLHTTNENMAATTIFYTDILGMTVAAADDTGKMLCLRYKTDAKNKDKKETDDKSPSSFYGVPTTLVFEPLSDDDGSLDQGNCFDHLVIATQADMNTVWTHLQESLEKREDLNCPLFMKPTEMFGQTVVGVMDPNGYKVIIAGKA